MAEGRTNDRDAIAWASSFLMRHCGRAKRPARRVPVVSLDTVISKWLRGREVSFVKVDAQGYDLRVAQSAGASAHRVQAMKLEVTADECQTPYVGGLTCTPTVDGMGALGFTADTGCAATRWRNHGCAADMLFLRRDLSQQAPMATHGRPQRPAAS